jgi:hypothetical protein
MPLEAQRGSRDMTLPMPDLGTRLDWMFNAVPWPIYPLERAPVRVI